MDIKLLKLEIRGIRNYLNNKFSVDFINQMTARDSGPELRNISESVYYNTLLAFTGINSAGKTMALKLIKWVLDTFINGKSTLKEIKDIADCEDEISVLFAIYVKESKSSSGYLLQDEVVVGLCNIDPIIKYEAFRSKKITPSTPRKTFFTFGGEPAFTRESLKKLFLSIMKNQDGNEVEKAISSRFSLRNDESILHYYVLLKEGVYLGFIKSNEDLMVPIDNEISFSVVKYLDSSIEKLERIDPRQTNEKEDLILLKFMGRPAVTIARTELKSYLSTGTIRAIKIYNLIINTLKNGGYLIIDEIEVSLHKTLIIDILKLFSNSETNPKGAVLLFSSHYAEVLDFIRRNDAVLICTKTDEGYIDIENLSSLMKRNENKKSKQYLSGLLGVQTTPDYKRHRDVLKVLREKIHAK